MQNRKDVEEARKEFGYSEKFNIVLATFYAKEQAELIPSASYNSLEEKLVLYWNIESILKGLGHKVFIPYRDVDPRWDADKILGVIHKIVIPESQMVICDSGIPSPVDPKKPSYFVNGMVETAHSLGIPTVHLRGIPSPDNEVPIANPHIDYVVKHVVKKDALRGVEIVAKHYWRNSN